MNIQGAGQRGANILTLFRGGPPRVFFFLITQTLAVPQAAASLICK